MLTRIVPCPVDPVEKGAQLSRLRKNRGRSLTSSHRGLVRHSRLAPQLCIQNNVGGTVRLSTLSLSTRSWQRVHSSMSATLPGRSVRRARRDEVCGHPKPSQSHICFFTRLTFDTSSSRWSTNGDTRGNSRRESCLADASWVGLSSMSHGLGFRFRGFTVEVERPFGPRLVACCCGCT